MTDAPFTLPFDLAAALAHLARCDEQLKGLIAETLPFEIDVAEAHTPYDALLESICHQSISGKAAATIYGRVKALGSHGRAPTPLEMLRIRKPASEPGRMRSWSARFAAVSAATAGNSTGKA